MYASQIIRVRTSEKPNSDLKTLAVWSAEYLPPNHTKSCVAFVVSVVFVTFVACVVFVVYVCCGCVRVLFVCVFVCYSIFLYSTKEPSQSQARRHVWAWAQVPGSDMWKTKTDMTEMWKPCDMNMKWIWKSWYVGPIHMLYLYFIMHVCTCQVTCVSYVCCYIFWKRSVHAYTTHNLVIKNGCQLKWSRNQANREMCAWAYETIDVYVYDS